MMPTLTVTPPPRPDTAIATPPEATADAVSPGARVFARVLREAEAPEASSESAAESVAARSTRNPAGRERTGSGRARVGDTPDAVGASGGGAARTKADATESTQGEARVWATPHDIEEDRVLAETAGIAPTATDTAIPILNAQAMALPATPPARIAPDRPAPHDSGDVAESAVDDAAAGRYTSGPVGSRPFAGRHPLAIADGRSDTAHGAAMPALPGEARARVDERGVGPRLVGPAMPATASTIEPPTPSLTAGSLPELTAGLPLPMGAAPLALERLAGHPADLARPAAEVRLTAELGSPAFTQALGTQLGVWMRDGVQEARIQLNPAELGPVQIQIALDGQSAQVDFHAAHARTREAIEASMPALASALRESGFTLAGGGVFGQGAGDTSARTPPRPPRDGERNALGAAALAVTGDEGLTAAAERSRSWRRGLLDVFA